MFSRKNEFNPIRATKIIVAAAIALLALIFALPAVSAVFGAQKLLPIYSVETPDKVVAITLNAAWGADDADILLEILDEFDAKATFFVCGYWVSKFPDAMRKFHAAGHNIANHGDTHAHVASLNFEQNVEEIAAAHTRVLGLLGVEMNLYRPPYGEYNDTVIKAAKSLKYHVIQWDVDSLDWKRPSPEAMAERVLNHKSLQNGSIILFHCDIPETPIALRKILAELKNRGYSFITVADLIHRDNYKINHEGRQIPN
ncbi:MAG: polysaccharide deacetylase family protein [Clostridiales bacterium]|jgi:peptidoglycan/xylan/chitin deacetylase (PgdA/CDA1 family)|nr:polysaccharide deacetylase family protein [Clostridiales bacterium]